jgi:hypothetical protein
MAIVTPVTKALATDAAKQSSRCRRFEKRKLTIWLASAALSLAILWPLVARGQTSLLLIATSASQPIQNKRADADDLSRMGDIAMIQRFRANGYLVPVPVSTRYYYVHGVSSRYRYLRPWTKVFLDRLSRQHYAKFKRKLRVTSLVRTVAYQRALSKRNRNAATSRGPLRSSHLTGATVDISKRNLTGGSISWMRNVLYSLREKQYLYAIEEFRQPTFHVMVFRSYEDYVKGRKSPQHKNQEGRRVQLVSDTASDRG